MYQKYVDFAACSTEIRELFNDLSDLNRIFMRLQLEYGVELKERKSAIIFDEVQLTPKARQAIKYFVKDGRYDYIETDSLISIRKNVKDILIPSEEVKFHMYPMDYEEFKWALGDMATIKLLRSCFQNGTSLGDATKMLKASGHELYYYTFPTDSGKHNYEVDFLNFSLWSAIVYVIYRMRRTRKEPEVLPICLPSYRPF